MCIEWVGFFRVQRIKLQMQRIAGSSKNQEKTMTGSKDLHLAELHTKAAYAHEAAAHEHSTGDHASAQELARAALVCSVEAVRHAEEIAKSAPQSMHA